MIVDREFFLSFTGADRSWAVWLLAELDAAGYSSVSQLRDFVAGANFAVKMDQAARRARRTLGVLSAAALQAPYVRQEWAQRLAADPTGEQRELVLVRVEPCDPAGLLGPVVYIDLVGLDEAAARARLREELAAAVGGQRPLPVEVEFPGGGPVVAADVGRARFPTALPPVWNVSFRRNRSFTGREQTLTELAERLGRGTAAAVTQALQGPGGVGKTALAAEYAYRYRSQFDTVWWVCAEQPATLVGDYAGLAGALHLPGAEQADQQQSVAAVRHWLEGHDRWLLVLDNADAPDTLTGLPGPLSRLVDLLPRVLHGQVLITSRDASWDEHAALAELEVFTTDEAVAFLLTRSGSSDEHSAVAVAELLGWLPLALEQAGAYVRETRIALSAYLDRLRQFPALTLARGRPRDRVSTDTVATTWQVSLERVRPVPGAVALLEVCSFLGPVQVPRELFARPIDPPAEELTLLASDPFILDEAIAAARRFGLVKASEHILVMHRLLQQVIRSQLASDTYRERAVAALRLITAAFPTDYANPDVWPIYARLLPHALAVAEHAEALAVEPEATAWLLNEAGQYLGQRADHQQARGLLERAVAIREAFLGVDHPATATSLHNLADVLYAQGNLDVARTLHERALAIHEASLGPDDRLTAHSLQGLAYVLRDQGDLRAARKLLERALAIDETRQGPDHLDTANSLHGLANVLHAQSDLDGARILHERALAIYQAQLGSDHPYTAGSLHGLAKVLADQGDLDSARTLYERALDTHQARLGLDHPTTARSLTNLARVLRDQGDLAGARTRFERALAILEASLGPDHPTTAENLNYLATVLHEEGDLAGARRLHERSLAIRETRLGPDHPYTGHSLTNLAFFLYDQGDLAGARTRFERALAIYEASLGPDHSYTALGLDNLATVLHDEGDLAAARRLHERALAIRETRLGLHHPDTIRSRRNLAAVVAKLKSKQ